jgi:hypothetical protein
MPIMTTEDRIRRCFRRNLDWDDSRRAASLGIPVRIIRAFRETGAVPATELPEAQTSPAPSGDQAAALRADFSLSGVHLLSRKPLDVMKGRFHALQKGVGYKVETLCRAWGCSEDSIREHGKKHGALRYVEATPGEYVAVIVHPETKQGI